MDAIRDLKQGFLPIEAGSQRLQHLTSEHMRLHKAVYGDALVKPKHHWQLDIAAQIASDCCVLDCFLIERHHCMVKRIADHVKNTSRFEKSVLSGVLNVLSRRMQDASDIAGLRGTSKKLPGSANVFVAARCECYSAQISIDDFVVEDDVVGRVTACLLEDSTVKVVVDTMTRLRSVSAQSDVWVWDGGQEVWQAQHVQQILAARAEEDGIVVVLR